MVLLVSAVMVGLAAFLVSEAVMAPQRRQQFALKRAAMYGHARIDPGQEVERFRERVVSPFVARLAAVSLRINPKASVAAIGTRLIASGLAPRVTITQFLALKSTLAFGGIVTGIAFALALGPAAGFVLVPSLAVLGFVFPNVLLGIRVRSRRDLIRGELPDALDLLAVSVEAGLGLDGAISKLTEHMEGALVDEFALTLGEMRIGEARHDALRRLAERVPAPEVAAFVRSVVQADQLGISLGRILRVQAADSRLRRQAAAEEKAMKAPIKMLFPTAVLIFPALFVVVLGPAFLNLGQYLR